MGWYQHMIVLYMKHFGQEKDGVKQHMSEYDSYA